LYKDYLKKSREKIKAAEYLLSGGFFEDAVSRAYYSMYYAARALLDLKEKHPKTHKGVITEFGLEFVKKGYIDEVQGKAIAKAKDRREEADYGVEFGFKKTEASEIISEAKDFHTKVEKAIRKLKK